MWKYTIQKQYKETIPSDKEKVSTLDGQLLPEGALLVVEAQFTDGDVHTYDMKFRISKEKDTSYADTVTRFLDQQLAFYEQNDDAKHIIEQAQAVDEYLASLKN